jgi:DNA-binding IclR family transcriptional regulator
VDAVDRALKIVSVFEASAQPMTLAALAHETGLYKSTLLRLLASLEASALVVRRTDRHYALGPFAARLGRSFEKTYGLRQCVLPVLHWLIAQGTESPSFHVRHDDQRRLCVFRLDSSHSTLDRVREGDLLPLSRGAAGTVLRRFTGGLSSVPGQSWVIASFGERDPSCAAAAAPVFGPAGELVGALSLSGPLERFSEAAVKKMSKPLLAGAERATRALGGEWPEPQRKSPASARQPVREPDRAAKRRRNA